MALTVLHTGQTGVERGADRAARLVGLPIDGLCSPELRDELGPLPPEIRQDLQPCTLRGARNALRGTLERAGALVIVVPNLSQLSGVPGADPLRVLARKAGIPTWVLDPTSDFDAVHVALRTLESRAPLRVLVTGPRETRWQQGERMGWRFVAGLNASSAVARKHRVLVVDDQPDVALSARSLVEALGHTCATATGGAEALRVASEFEPDIALLDIHLPDVSGYEVARQLRERQTRPLFLAAITGWMASSASTALEAGFDRHVVKPATTTVIRQLLSDATEYLAKAA